MRTSRCILYTAVTTILCLLYVFQQTEIVKLGYKITVVQKVLETSLDRKTMLEYALSKLESPQNLDSNLFLKNDGFEMAQSFKLVKVGSVGRASETFAKVGNGPEGRLAALKRLAFSSLFASRQAEAKTVK